MKKLIFSAFILAALFSCKKNEAPDQLTEETTNNKPSVVYKPIFIQTQPLQKINSTDLENITGFHKNDTIYVTNFFATWCGPCMKEIPHFKEKMEELKGKPVKFTFVSVDAKEDWNTAVSDFADEYDIRKNVVLFDASTIAPDYFTTITKTWDGGSIPFTVIKKGDKSDETVGMMSKEDLDAKLNFFK